jgi:hypothetical protein
MFVQKNRAVYLHNLKKSSNFAPVNGYYFAAALCCAVMTSATKGALPGKFSVAADKQV